MDTFNWQLVVYTNPKYSPIYAESQTDWTCHKEGLILTILITPHNLDDCFFSRFGFTAICSLCNRQDIALALSRFELGEKTEVLGVLFELSGLTCSQNMAKTFAVSLVLIMY